MSSKQHQQPVFMSSSSYPLIWYLLLDSTTGQPYKGTTADKVFLSSQADVADFRKAVKAENSHKLSSIDAADLLVYKNKTSFDKRNSDNEKEEPLEEDSYLDDLGKSKKEALIVVVPAVIPTLGQTGQIYDIMTLNSSGYSSTLSKNFMGSASVAEELLKTLHELTFRLTENNQSVNNILDQFIIKDFKLLSCQTSKTDNTSYRLKWFTHYGMTSKTDVGLPNYGTCHLLGMNVPTKYLICAHIFQKRWRDYANKFRLSSINDSKNILILLKIFEQAFYAGQIIFLFQKSDETIKYKILDPDLKNKNLDESMKDIFPNYKAGDINFGLKRTFQDFDGETLYIDKSKRPYIRCLSFHALIARKKALNTGWIQEGELKELDSDDMWSDGYLDETTRGFVDKWRKDVSNEISD